MKVTSAKFITSAVKPGQYPQTGLNEIAFAGRSNVGKSSLINSLIGRKGLVKVSKTPGKTRLINFFDINGKIVFVDLPGYGFANVPLEIKENWGAMVEGYLNEREELKGVAMLLDCRRIPNEDDKAMIYWLNRANVPAIIVFTKIDKIPKTKRPRMIKQALAPIEEYLDDDVRIVTYSSQTGEGKKELWSAILGYPEPLKK